MYIPEGSTLPEKRKRKKRETMSEIKISAKVAFDLVKEAARLFRDGNGISIQPDGQDPLDFGFIDEMEPESDMRYWANQLLFFARTVHGILHQQLLEQEDDL